MPGRIAVVEDEDSVRKFLVAILEDRDYEVQAFSCVADATAGLQGSPPDLLIVDVHLPDGCGLDLVGTLRGRSGRKVPAIVLSGLREECDIVRGFAAGACDYLPKPFSRDELLARCAVHLARISLDSDAPADAGFGLPQRNGLAFGRYRVEREIGRGGYGEVFLAKDTMRHGATVALKVLTPVPGAQQEEEARVRFIRETYTLASVRDPAVVAVHDVGSTQGRLYFAMEYVEGESLTARVARLGPIDESDARSLASGALNALVALGRARLLHRDIKPANVILRGCRIDSPVLVDFGLAKRPLDRGSTQPDMMMGTLPYMPPEVIRGHAPDRRSDLFALGLTLRYALTGEEIFPLLDGVELLSAIARGSIPPPDVELTPSFARFLESLWADDPDRRFASAEVALQSLAECADVGVRA